MRHWMFLTLLIFVIVSLSAVAAQDEPTCDIPTLTETYAAQLSEATTLEDVQAVQSALSSEIAKCRGFYFEDSQATVIGPLDIPAGIYKTTVTTDGYFILRLTVLEGECDFSGLGFILSEGDAVDGADAIFESEDCRVVLETSNVTADWTLQFEPLQ